jgi:hypothetical protein
LQGGRAQRPAPDFHKHRISLDKFRRKVPLIRQEDILNEYPQGYPESLSVELFRVTYPEDLLEYILIGYPPDCSVGLILHYRISWISQDKSGYPN